MTYFELYGLPETLSPDLAQLRKRFYQLSREHHPDFHANAAYEAQAEALQLSTLINQAYQTLSQPDRLLQYVLDQHGLLHDSAPQELPHDFLSEMMDLNEQLMELQMVPDETLLSEVEQQLNEREQDLMAQAQPLRTTYSGLPPAAQEKVLLQLRELYFKERYLLRIRQSLSKIAPPNT